MVEVRLRPGGSLNALEPALREQANEANNVVTSFVGGHPRDYLDRYLAWVNQAWRALEYQLRHTQLEELLHTRHYWALRQMDGSQAWLTGQIKVELNSRREALVELADQAKLLAGRWGVASGMIVVPDTNVLLHSTKYFDELDWYAALQIVATIHLVIPLAVIDQIDNLKRSKQEVRSRARQTAKKIETILGSRPLERVALRTNDYGRVMTTVEVLLDPLDHQRLPDSDSEIVDRAAYLAELAVTPVHVATFDNLMSFRAAAAGLRVVRPLPEYERDDPPSLRRKQAPQKLETSS
jgi:rRNA-processing protein FCF1